jgi:aspartate carbamoyltransferase
MDLKGQHILSASQFDKKTLLELFKKAQEMEKILSNKGQSDLAFGKVMATLFFEPSTRTRFSFETAMMRLGGRVIANSDMVKTSSTMKMESLEDTGKTVSQMADIIVMRHPEAGSVGKLAFKSDVPVINAGDGPAQHPTQALLDVYTIWKSFGKLDELTIGMVGDLKNGRVPHSQCELLKQFDVNFIFVSPEGLKMPREIVGDLQDGGHYVEEVSELKVVISKMDVIAMTRVQKERFENEKDYEKYVGSYVLNNEMMTKAKNNAIVIHPLPRVDEISTEIDTDPRAKYFEQVKNGVAIRMALIAEVLGL